MKSCGRPCQENSEPGRSSAPNSIRQPATLQRHVGAVVALAAAEDLDQPLLHPVQVAIRAAEDHRALVLREREAEQQVALAAARRAAIEQQVGLRFVGRDLRPVARVGRPPRRHLPPERRVELPLRAGGRLGERGARPDPLRGMACLAWLPRRGRRAVRPGCVQRAPDLRETGRIAHRQPGDEDLERAQAVLVRDRDRMRGVEAVEDAALQDLDDAPCQPLDLARLARQRGRSAVRPLRAAWKSGAHRFLGVGTRVGS